MTVARRRLASAAQGALVLVAFLSITAGTARAHGFDPPSRGVLLTFAADASGYVGNDIRGWNVGGRVGFAGWMGEREWGYERRYFTLGGGAFILRQRALEFTDVFGGLYLRFGFGVAFTEVAVGFQQDGPVYVHGLVGVGLPHIVSVGAGLARIEGRPALLAAASVGWGFRVD